MDHPGTFPILCQDWDGNDVVSFNKTIFPHTGVSNKQFGVERPLMSERYRSKSMAEQNSLEVGWDVLMHSHFRDMPQYIILNQRRSGQVPASCCQCGVYIE